MNLPNCERNMSNRSGITNPSFENDEKQCDEKNKEREVKVKKSQKNDETGLDVETKIYVYVSHFLSAWGDRMWSFGVGLFMIELAPESLQLVATYGFSKGAAVLLFGAIIGDWVDSTPRLRAARISLVLQNLLVVVCVAVVFTVVTLQTTLETIWPEKGALKLCFAVIIIFAILSDLSSVARKIAIERDWIVEICGRDRELLASMSATLRAIDLTTAILAPVATGQIMYFIALRYGAVFIAGWNIVSVFVEYILIWKVYEKVPGLKKSRKDRVIEEVQAISPSDDIQPQDETTQYEPVSDIINNSPDPEVKKKGNNSNKQVKERTCHPLFYKIFKSFIMIVKGWKTYMKYDVAFAGLGLAAVYMTVMGFDNITVGYAYSQGISESILGILMAAGSIFGIIGTFTYPRLQRRIGLERTGLFGLGSEIFCLCFCVAAVFAPGSPFDLLHRTRDSPSENISMVLKTPSVIVDTIDNNTITYNITDISNISKTHSKQSSYISIGLYLGGLIAARFGLWLADLTITQLFLQSVIESERGIVSGIQSSLNQLMDMLKFLMVILAPYPEEYGLLVFISFAFVCIGWMFYAKYSHSSRGHLLHFEKICSSKQNNDINHEVNEFGSVVMDVTIDVNVENEEKKDS